MRFLEGDQRISRRHLLGIPPLVGAALLSGCLSEQTPTSTTSHSKVPSRYPTIQEYLNNANETIIHPIYRAASVLITSGGYVGHGGLYRLTDGTPYLRTAWHVVQARNGAEFNVIIPGVGYFGLGKRTWYAFEGNRTDTDANVFLTLPNPTGLVEKKLEELIKKGQFLPLEPKENVNFKRGQRAFLPTHDGNLTQLSYNRYDSKNNLYSFDAENGYTCKGFSGTPTLIEENGALSNKSCGLLIAANIRKDCGKGTVLVRPHN